MKPEGDEAKELEEILAKRQKKGKVDDDKPLEERSILHSKFCVSTTPFFVLPIWVLIVFSIDTFFTLNVGSVLYVSNTQKYINSQLILN